jgi:hypothetical protein
MNGTTAAAARPSKKCSQSVRWLLPQLCSQTAGLIRATLTFSNKCQHNGALHSRQLPSAGTRQPRASPHLSPGSSDVPAAPMASSRFLCVV